jgi:hypothetical protein
VGGGGGDGHLGTIRTCLHGGLGLGSDLKPFEDALAIVVRRRADFGPILLVPLLLQFFQCLEGRRRR